MTWEEPALPDMPEPKKRPVRKPKPEPVRTDPQWRKHAHASRVHCDACLAECVKNERTYPWQSSWIRTDVDGSQALLCYEHAATYKDAPSAIKKRGTRP